MLSFIVISMLFILLVSAIVKIYTFYEEKKAIQEKEAETAKIQQEQEETNRKLKEKNDEFLSFLKKQGYTLLDWKDEKYKRQTAINVWFKHLITENSCLFSSWKWKEPHNLNDIILITVGNKNIPVHLKFNQMYTLYVAEATYLDPEMSKLMKSLQGDFCSDEISEDKWISYTNTILTTENNLKFMETAIAVANAEGGVNFKYSNLIKKDFDVISYQELEGLRKNLITDFHFSKVDYSIHEKEKEIIFSCYKEKNIPNAEETVLVEENVIYEEAMLADGVKENSEAEIIPQMQSIVHEGQEDIIDLEEQEQLLNEAMQIIANEN